MTFLELSPWHRAAAVAFGMVVGCGPSISLDDDDGSGGDAAETEAADTDPAATDASPGATTSPGDGADSAADGEGANESVGGAWPPPDGFDPAPDVGDGVLSHEMLIVADLPDGPLYLWMYAERLGDSFQGQLAPARLDGTWMAAAAPASFDGGAFDDNVAHATIEALALPAGLHPFSDAGVSVDLDLEVWIYGEDLLCGTMEIDLNGPDLADHVAVPFAAHPIEAIGADPAPPLACG